LKGHLSPQQLREAIDDGSISNFVNWRAVFAGDSFLIPAGTIHAIGAGLVVAEIQQRSDVTFRLFDYGSQRELHTAQAAAVALTDAVVLKIDQTHLAPHRTQVVSCPYFSMERIDLPPNSSWRLKADGETWMLGVSGEALAGLLSIASGESAFVKSESFDFRVGPKGFVALVAYAGDVLMPDLLAHIGSDGAFSHGSQITAAVRPAGFVQ
jgi:mannose-6-phosphate isomerase